MYIFEKTWKTAAFAVLGTAVVLCGCASDPYGGNYSTYCRSYSASSATTVRARPVTYSSGVQQTPVAVRPQTTVTTSTTSFTDPGAVGGSFSQDYSRMREQERERKIMGFLNGGGDAMWKGSVKDTREKFKTAIMRCDKQIAQLRNDITLAGGSPENDSRYQAVKANRDRLSAKLSAMDDRILDVIATKTTGEAARRLIWKEEDKIAANAALGNLENAKNSYESKTDDLLRQSNW